MIVAQEPADPARAIDGGIPPSVSSWSASSPSREPDDRTELLRLIRADFDRGLTKDPDLLPSLSVSERRAAERDRPDVSLCLVSAGLGALMALARP